MKKIRVTIDIEVSTESDDGIIKTIEEIAKNIVVVDSDIVDGFEITTNFDDIDNTSDFFLNAAYFHKIEIIDDGDNLKLNVLFVSSWDGGVTVTTSAVVNCETGEVTDIECADVEGLDNCEEQYIIMNDKKIYIYEDEHGYDYWADLKGEM